jgi:hypothetical protein
MVRSKYTMDMTAESIATSPGGMNDPELIHRLPMTTARTTAMTAIRAVGGRTALGRFELTKQDKRGQRLPGGRARPEPGLKQNNPNGACQPHDEGHD